MRISDWSSDVCSSDLPDVRDGLKPVHRRILFSAHESGFTHNKPYRKSARIVGDVIGKYHPHGDSAIYDALARMTQDWSMRVPLIDGQGNFGSMDRSEEHTSELQSLMRISYAVFCLQKKKSINAAYHKAKSNHTDT